MTITVTQLALNNTFYIS